MVLFFACGLLSPEPIRREPENRLCPNYRERNEAFHGLNFVGVVAAVIGATERRNSEVSVLDSSRKTYTGFVSISTATSSAGSLPLFTHAWLVPRWITTSNGFKSTSLLSSSMVT